ncbi:type I-E CRISPR-associated protein Cas5/CasD [Nocardioides yefusunii]|uniref:Type I-E CRISPR-associated protein Cas5/CasD n=1 Tax=Nocardioides yefusunii TaxID=2500546 RepID=A0ABW1QZ21_9ACTN|nr:type I-E CRISPR-associated protein Cas5/CasD [Nocardioides yefusunii]
MSTLVLRLAAPLQAWSGYRHAVNMRFVAPTEALPRKSGVNGLLGAALGPHDQGYGCARDLDSIGERYRLQVRVDARNPAAEDFQVLSSLTGPAHRGADRSHRVGSASTSAFPANRDRGNFPTTVARRDFLAHSEFIAALETDASTAEAWISALRDPVFMPYLGRRSCAPTFPFVLGIHDGSLEDLFAHLPHVDRNREEAPLLAYTVRGSYDLHHADEHPRPYTPDRVDRTAQLTWVKENLR